jgi:hypothetical protein
MPNFDEVKKMLQGATTPQDKADAARALDEHTPPERRGKHILTMSKSSENNVVSLGNLPNAMQDPEVYDRVKQVITKGK